MENHNNCHLSIKTCLNPFPAILIKSRLLSHLLMHFGSLYCKHFGSRSDCSYLIRVHSVCFQIDIILKSIWVYAADVISRQLFQDKNIHRIWVNQDYEHTLLTQTVEFTYCTRHKLGPTDPPRIRPVNASAVSRLVSLWVSHQGQPQQPHQLLNSVLLELHW